MRTGPPRQHRFPLAPLMAAARAGTPSELGMIVRRPSQTISRYSRGGVPTLAADEFACRLGLHPSAIWPDWFDIDGIYA